MRIVGLTGSIGMGKSTTAAMFADLGVPVHDSDAAVHALYQEADTVTAVDHAFPGVAVDGEIDRKKLSSHVIGKSDAMARLEAIVHPRVHAKEQAFLQEARAAGAPYVILDIPLLYETGAEARCDQVLVVTASAETQRQRVLARPEMSEEKFEAILAKQTPDAEKRARADFIVETDDGMDSARAQVHAIHEHLLQGSNRGAES